jgi:hypothetical protein
MTGSFRVRLWRREALTRDLSSATNTTTLRSRAGHSILSQNLSLVAAVLLIRSIAQINK